jgi:hypothetical protein
MTFQKLLRKPSQVRAFTGLTVSELEEFASIYNPLWDMHRSKTQDKRLNSTSRIRSAGGGRKLSLSLFNDRLLCFMIYSKLYCTYDLMGYLFDIDAATACRTIADIRSVVGDKLLVNRTGRRIRTIDELLSVYPELKEVVLDATEQKIPRPKNKKKRKTHHSGKKQAFTIMTQVITDKEGVMLHVSDSMAGRGHDVRLFKKSPLPKWLSKHGNKIHVRADGGYQGMQEQYPDMNMTVPIKRSKKKKPILSSSERKFNKKHSSVRIVVEHGFGSVKQFQLLAQIYRGKEKDYKKNFIAIASIRNFRLLSRMEQRAQAA